MSEHDDALDWNRIPLKVEDAIERCTDAAEIVIVSLGWLQLDSACVPELEKIKSQALPAAPLMRQHRDTIRNENAAKMLIFLLLVLCVTLLPTKRRLFSFSLLFSRIIC